MVLASFRFGFLVTTLLASLHVTAAPRFWTLTGVRFDDETIASGYFSYDDATQTIAHWNVQVDKRLFFGFPAYTYVPGNSSPYTFQAPFAAPRSLGLSAPLGSPPGGDFRGRGLQITPLTPLDGSNAAVPLITSALDGASFFVSRENFGDGDDSRVITAGTLVLMPPPAVAIVQVDEFYNTVLRHYFLTASAAEKQDLDTGVHPGWQRTGESFKAFAPGSLADGSINPVCRYYGDPRRGLNSHFYSADGGECLQVFRKYGGTGCSRATTCSRSTCPIRRRVPVPVERFRYTGCGISQAIQITAIRQALRSRRACSLPVMSWRAMDRTAS